MKIDKIGSIVTLILIFVGGIWMYYNYRDYNQKIAQYAIEAKEKNSINKSIATESDMLESNDNQYSIRIDDLITHGLSVDKNDQIAWQDITMHKVSGDSFYSSLVISLEEVAIQIGEAYELSYWIQNESERFIWMKALSNSSQNGDGAKYTSEIPRRVSEIIFVDENTDKLCIFFNAYGATEENVEEFSMYIGGIELRPISKTEKRDVVMIGDSTMAGSSGKIDRLQSREISRWAEGLLMNHWYNRAVGGERTDQMISRWQKDVIPVSSFCKFAFIQGGINDLSQGYTVENVKENIQIMHDMAIDSDMIPVIATITPFVSSTEGANESRHEVNEWIRSNFENVADLDIWLRDPNNLDALNPKWIGDGTHYTQKGKEEAGKKIAELEAWQ